MNDVRCSTCKTPFPKELIKNKIKLMTKELLQYYYCTEFKCSENPCGMIS